MGIKEKLEAIARAHGIAPSAMWRMTFAEFAVACAYRRAVQVGP